ncbi:Na+/H+ antiporter [Actinoplanes sp. CA-131856]
MSRRPSRRSCSTCATGGVTRPVTVSALVILLVIGAAVLTGTTVARRAHVSAPVVLLVCGALLGLVPGLSEVSLPPDVVLLLFLPILLFWDSLSTSLREIRSNLRGVVLNSTVLVVATAAAVAAAAHALGLLWGPAWVLGAALAPTDATAAGSLLSRGLSRRRVTVLRAESLVNDGTALVVYGLAVGVTVGEEQLGAAHVTGLFALAYLGGALAGIVTAWILEQVRRRLDDPLNENVITILGPFAAYLLAEICHASGVLAVVVYGLIRSQVAPRRQPADTRQLGTGFLTLTTYLLNGSLFVLVGIQLHAAARGLDGTDLVRALTAVAVISLTVIGTRFAWFFTVPYLIRALDRRAQQARRRVHARERMISAVAGFRGAVSLAAALAVPESVGSGSAFPDRDLIVFVTAGVIVVTLAQGLVMPAVVRWAGAETDTSAGRERRLAEIQAVEAALDGLEDEAHELGAAPDVVERTRAEYREHLAALRADAAGSTDAASTTILRHQQQYRDLRIALIARERAEIIALRDRRRIDDLVLRRIEAVLDAEEVRLTGRDVAD